MKDLFGKRITNPYPDTEDEAALERYKDTKNELENALEKSLPQIIKMTNALPTL